MITDFGKMLRKIRIDKGEVLKNMAEELGFTSSYLSAIECGKRNIPDSMIDKLVSKYRLTAEEKVKLEEARDRSLKSIEIYLEGISEEKQELALKFARTFEDIDGATVSKIRDLLMKED